MFSWINIFSQKERVDAADLTQSIIIISGFAVAAIVAIGAITSVLLNKGEATASCISNANSFTSGNNSALECKDFNEKATEKSYSAINSNYGKNPSDNDYLETPKQKTQREKDNKMKEDLERFHETLTSFYKSNGRYPTNAELTTLNFKVSDIKAYEGIDTRWNFDYCRSNDGQGFVSLASPGRDEVFYVTNKNSTAKTHEVVRSEMLFNGTESGGRISPCYSGTPYSIADAAGVSEVGKFNENGTLNRTFMGTNGVNLQNNNGWAM